jgi:hypothetical protein
MSKNKIFEEWQVTRTKLLSESFDKAMILQMHEYIEQLCDKMKQVSSSLEGSEVAKKDPSLKGDMQRISDNFEKFEEDFYKMKVKIEGAERVSKKEHSETPREEEQEHSSGSDEPEA